MPFFEVGREFYTLLDLLALKCAREKQRERALNKEWNSCKEQQLKEMI